MKTKLFAIALLLGFITLNSCKKAEIKATETDNNEKKDTSSLVNPMAHVMDSANIPVKDSLVEDNKIILNKDAITLNSVKEGSTEKAYLVFNEDQSKAELFLPNEKLGTILERKGSEGNYTWTDGKLELIQWKGYVLRTLKQGNNLFAGDVKM
ncbi:hypothetical protein [Halpernia sp.]|uniref:hypothetical protein n=1 Tax=Halpernia sp. TaxID=2782209 RepID=UPI003A8E288B